MSPSFIPTPMRLFSLCARVLCAAALCASVAAAAERPGIDVKKPVLQIPRDDSAPKQLVRLLDNGREIRRFEIQMADNDQAPYWANIDLRPWIGKTLAVEIVPSETPAAQVALFRQGDAPREQADVYREPLRPHTRFTARTGRLNDPNGLAYYNGEYHLFFQLAPYSAASGSKHWGHAVSKDLVHWQELDIALFPDEKGMVFSGSAVVDVANTSGFDKDGKAPLVLHYTVAPGKMSPQGMLPLKERYQALAYSLDGRTFVDRRDLVTVPYFADGNRDPKVVWHAPSQQWVMALYAGGKIPNPDGPDKKPIGVARVIFFGSTDMRHWEKLSAFDGESAELTGKLLNYLSECPDLFPLTAPDGSQKWILTGGKGKYRIGNFDGKNFIPETPVLPLWVGARYAAQTFNNTPDPAKRIQIGWMIDSTFSGMPFQQAMDIPVELSLVNTPEGLRMRADPIKAIESLRETPVVFPTQTLTPGAHTLPFPPAKAYEVVLALRPQGAQKLTLVLPQIDLVYDVPSQTLRAGKEKLPVPLTGGALRLRVIADANLLQVFRADGLQHLSLANLKRSANPTFALTVEGGPLRIETLTYYPLHSIWNSSP